jgi:hypothetical protein
MDFESRSSTLIINRLLEGKTTWPENSRQFWTYMEREHVSWFNRRALSTGFWSPGASRYKTIEFWDSVVHIAVEQLILKFRFVVQQTYGLWRVGYGDYEGWEEQWLRSMVGELVWYELDFGDMAGLVLWKNI